MSYLRLGICVSGVYAMFLLWAIAQERLSVPFQRIDGKGSDKFHSPLIIGLCQSILCSISALVYLLARRDSSLSFQQLLGLEPSPKAVAAEKEATNGSAKPSTRFSKQALLKSYIQTSFLITSAAPFGFAALSYISYPAMVLGKSCKLVPVMIMNVLLYRRKFAPHKYLVVALVTSGITIFMFLGDQKKGSKQKGSSVSDNPYASAIGVTYLLINLALDGAINSTQDEIFTRYKVSGQQMMFWINVFCTLISVSLSVLPLPHIPVIHPSPGGTSELMTAIEFIQTHPTIMRPLAEFAITGALGQLFIFETLQHFGSLALVTVTLTRKLFTMLLSVVVYKHKLTPGQWFGAAVVFGGISVEALVKRKDVHAKRVVQEKEKAKIKSI